MEQNDKNKLIEEILLGEYLVFGLLGRVLYNRPDESLLKALIDEDVFSEIPFGADQKETNKGQKILLNWAKNNQKGLSEDTLKDINADYTSLLVGVGKVLAPPWESVYFTEDRLIFQEQTIQVRKWYRRFGLELENLHKEPDDHIGLEMSFIAFLAELGVKALQEKNTDEFESLNESQSQFLSNQLLKWGPLWCGLVIQHAKTDYYQGLGHLTLGSLLAIADHFNLQIPKEVDK